MYYPHVRCALSLASFHHVPWDCSKIKRASLQWKRQVECLEKCIKRFLHISLVSFHRQKCWLGGGEGAVRVFLVSPIGTDQTRLCEYKEHGREKRTSRRTACQWSPLGPLLHSWVRYTLRAALSEAKGIHLSQGSLTRATNTNYSLQLSMLPATNYPLKCLPQKYIKSRA